MNVLKWLDKHAEEAVLAMLLVLIACVELLQVLFRNLPFVDALTWPEEFCRFCWIWSVFLSLPFTIRNGGMLRVSVLLDTLPHTLRALVNILIDLVNAAVMSVLFRYSVTVVGKIRESAEASPAMGWPMWLVYSVMAVGFGLAAARGAQMAAIHVQQFREKNRPASGSAAAETDGGACAEKYTEGGGA